MTPIELLDACTAIIEDPERWTRRVDAERADGVAVAGDAADACRWCSSGVIHKLRPKTQSYPADRVARALDKAAEEFTGIASFVRLNDNNPHPRVLKMWRRAREILVMQL